MPSVRHIINPAQLERYFSSLKAEADALKYISENDILDIGYGALFFLQDRFPKAKGTRKTEFAPGARKPGERGPELARGWRIYRTSASGEGGFVIRHARQGDNRVATILAALDQGSRAHTIYLKHAEAFRFLGNQGRLAGKVVIRQGSAGIPQGIRIPARQPLPDAEGYIKPTQRFIQEQIDYLVAQRQKDLEDINSRKKSRLGMLRAAYAKLAANKITDQP